MWLAFLLLSTSVIQTSYATDVALLFGSDSKTVSIYTGHLDSDSPSCVLDQPKNFTIASYTGFFESKLSSVYIDNIGVFVCGGTESPVDFPSMHGYGCSWLQHEPHYNGGEVSQSSP